MSEIARGTTSAIVRVGVDLAKQVIQVHGVDSGGRRVVGRTLKRDQFATWAALGDWQQHPVHALLEWAYAAQFNDSAG